MRRIKNFLERVILVFLVAILSVGGSWLCSNKKDKVNDNPSIPSFPNANQGVNHVNQNLAEANQNQNLAQANQNHNLAQTNQNLAQTNQKNALKEQIKASTEKLISNQNNTSNQDPMPIQNLITQPSCTDLTTSQIFIKAFLIQKVNLIENNIIETLIKFKGKELTPKMSEDQIKAQHNLCLNATSKMKNAISEWLVKNKQAMDNYISITKSLNKDLNTIISSLEKLIPPRTPNEVIINLSQPIFQESIFQEFINVIKDIYKTKRKIAEDIIKQRREDKKNVISLILEKHDKNEDNEDLDFLDAEEEDQDAVLYFFENIEHLLLHNTCKKEPSASSDEYILNYTSSVLQVAENEFFKLSLEKQERYRCGLEKLLTLVKKYKEEENKIYEIIGDICREFTKIGLDTLVDIIQYLEGRN